MRSRFLFTLVFVVFLAAVSGCLGNFTQQLNGQSPSTTVKKFVCNPPYIQVGRDCCLDTNGNGVCDKDESSETTETQTTETVPQPTNQPANQKHNACENGMCVQKDGSRQDECSASSECKHMKCNAGYCVEANEPGADECVIDNQCRHKVCNATHFCVDVMSKGVNECQSTSQCQANVPKHKACVSSAGVLKCTLVEGSGSDECSDDMSCYQVTNGVCVDGMCVAGGIGNVSCTLDQNCYHGVCDASNKCVKVNTPGESECINDNSCWVRQQLKEYHLACVNGTCVRVDGSGSNQCDYVGLTTACRHNVCQAGDCIQVLTPGSNQCTSRQDCSGPTHHICTALVPSTCVEVAGAGRDECTTNNQCN